MPSERQAEPNPPKRLFLRRRTIAAFKPRQGDRPAIPACLRRLRWTVLLGCLGLSGSTGASLGQSATSTSVQMEGIKMTFIAEPGTGDQDINTIPHGMEWNIEGRVYVVSLDPGEVRLDDHTYKIKPSREVVVHARLSGVSIAVDGETMIEASNVARIEAAAQGGAAKSQNTLGILYYTGDGVEKNLPMAAKF